jgi:tetratricopeptide (TPR) repeat protein
VIVKISSLTGLNREVLTTDQGRYEFMNIPGGRYTLTVVNPQDPTHYTEPTLADTSRSAGNRVIVHLYLRVAPVTAKKGAKPGVVSVAEASQQIPKEARKAYEEGLKRRGENQLDKALASFDRAIQLYPEYFQALAQHGEIRISRNQISEAVDDFERALKLYEDYEPALRGIGYCKLEQQQFAEAARYLERALSVDPNNSNSHLFLGIATLALDRRDEAFNSLQQALKLDSRGAVTAHIYLADLHAREGRYKQAADELRVYLDARPDAPNAARLRMREAELRARAKPM